MTVAHHGGELSLLQAALVAAGSLPVLLLLLRKEIARLGRRLVTGPTRSPYPNETTKAAAGPRRLLRAAQHARG